MFKRLIIATDLSKDSNVLIDCLGRLKAYGVEECLLVQFISVDEIVKITQTYDDSILPEYSKILQNQKKVLEGQGYSVETRILSGYSIKEINRIAVEEDYSAIVVGAQKRLSDGEVFFSELAYDLIYISQKPVLLIRTEERPKEGQPAAVETVCCEISNHVLFPTDFSDNADLAFTYIMEMASGKAKKITLLHVQDKSRISPYLENRVEEFNEIDNARLQSMKKILQEKGNAEVDTVLKYGSPSIEILNLAKQLDANLVVMGTQGRGYVKEFFLGSVSHNVARQSISSVLLIPTKRG